MAPRKKRKSPKKINNVKRVASGIQKQYKKKVTKKNDKLSASSEESIINEAPTSLFESEENNSCKKTITEPCPIHGKIVDENTFGADFIPLSSCHTYPAGKGIVTLVSSSTIENRNVPMTITVDDDDNSSDNDSVCIAEKDTSSESESINDSIQIVEVTVKSPNAGKLGQRARKSYSRERNGSLSVGKRRKVDDSIEILETDNSEVNHQAKETRKTINLERSSISRAGTSSSDEKLNGQEQDDDIVIVDTIDNNSRDSVKVVNDFIPLRIASTLVKEKNRWKNTFTKRKHHRLNYATREGTNTDVSHSCIFHDTVGNTLERSAKYKSPLLSVANKDADANISYHNVYGNNMYNPNSVQKTGLRPVVIDGSNVAFGHGGKNFSTRGIEICVNYFVKRGHWVVAFVPLFRRNEVSDADRIILDDLKKKNQLAFTPSRYLHGRRVASYDDRFIVQCAAELGGIVVSTDNYRDLVGENEAWRETIEKRLLMFTWVGDLLMFPDDPNGRVGPRLAEFLKFSQ